MDTNTTAYDYDAFISYRHTEPDITIAKKLVDMLERYKAPSSVSKKSDVKMIKKIFRDREELPTTTDLSDSIMEALRHSKYLIVVCSPRTPESEWVLKEIQLFKELHGFERIQALLIEGEPEESFPDLLHYDRQEEIDESGNTVEKIKKLELLAADIRPDELKGKNRQSYETPGPITQKLLSKSLKLLKTERLRCLAPMFGCKFDELYQRHLRRTMRNAVLSSLSAALLFAIFAGYAIYMNSQIALQRDNALIGQSKVLSNLSLQALGNGDRMMALLLALDALPNDLNHPDRPFVPEAWKSVSIAVNDVQNGRTILKHNGPVQDCSFSPDGKTILTTSSDNTVRLWDVENGRELKKIAWNGNFFRNAMFSPDGKRVITLTEDGVGVWDLDGGKELHLLIEFNAPLSIEAQQSRDGKYIVTPMKNDAVLWNAVTGEELARFTGHTAAVRYAGFSPDGKQIVTASTDTTVRIWDTSSKSELFVLKGHTKSVSTACFSPDGNRIVTASDDGTMKIWDAKSGKEITSLKGMGIFDQDFLIVAFDFSPDGKLLITSAGAKAYVWDLTTGKQVAVLQGQSGNITCVKFRPDGLVVATTSKDGTTLLFDTEAWQISGAFYGHTDIVNSIAFSPGGEHAVTTSTDGTARIWDIGAKRLDIASNQLFYLNADSNDWVNPQFSPDRNRLVAISNSDQRIATVWDVKSGNSIATLKGHRGYLINAEFSPDGKYIITSSWDSTARIWDAETGKHLTLLSGFEHIVRNAHFSPDGKFVITASWDDTIRVWDVQDGKELKKFVTSSDFNNGRDPSDARLSPDGRLIVASLSDKTIRIIRVEDGKELCQLNGHFGDINQVHISPDGTLAVTVSHDMTARIWDIRKGIDMIAFEGGNSNIREAEFSPDGKRILTFSDKRKVSIWDLESKSELTSFEGDASFPIMGACFGADSDTVILLYRSVYKVCSIEKHHVIEEALQQLGGRELTDAERETR